MPERLTTPGGRDLRTLPFTRTVYRSCCGTEQTWAGPLERLPRGRPPKRKMRVSRKIHHVRGDEHFWHWEDQIGRLVEDPHRPMTAKERKRYEHD